MPHRLVELPLLRRLKPGLHVHEEEALNAEPALALLDEPITPVDSFFIRNNGHLPEIDDSSEWTLTIDGCPGDAVVVGTSFVLSAIRRPVVGDVSWSVDNYSASRGGRNAADIVTLSGTTGNTVTVTALSPGAVMR